ncbi:MULTISPECIES: transcriptional regulator [Gordonia]|uniref:Transcriptional regulator n=1 Tax=Gordonia amicalis TaxID=89053 RepID=A0AAE4RA87_9ACTN|nr:MULTISPECIES: transcriptional regulator [Gordonia]KAF0967163.1 hypothetical protein BPODLACK_04347 [Gordonia sp. YY1]MDV6313270.1 transcriptional regulator [Gordonia amicalis]
MSSSPRRTHRPALVVLTVVAAAACLILAWWQWSRFESSSGSGQNLGYALQWPAFAIAVIYAYRRFVVLERDPEEARKAAANARAVAEIPEGILPERPTTPSASSLATDHDPVKDAALIEYNRYLAELRSADTTDAPSSKGPQ